MRESVLTVDIVIAVLVAVLVTIFSPGVAISGMVAIVVLIGLLASLLWRRRR